ncbi:MAG: DUF6282 family protein, partial [Candidatus Micrarchaeota archaeon]|nr:DUF6282 family protein [Candidatus Micrarchaeota archaeon]
MSQLQSIVRESIDIHYHVGPEPIPRLFTPEQLSCEKGKIRGIVLKSHYHEAIAPKISGLLLVSSVVLNNFVGGINPNAVESI